MLLPARAAAGSDRLPEGRSDANGFAEAMTENAAPINLPGDPGLSASGDDGHGHGSKLGLAAGAIGVVFGDIGTSPLYAFRETFLARVFRSFICWICNISGLSTGLPLTKKIFLTADGFSAFAPKP